MITFEKALSIAFDEKTKMTTPKRKVIFTHAKDCGKFWSISFCFKNELGESYETYGPKMRFDIDKENGMILDYPPYRPGTEFSKIYDKGKRLEIPDEYRH